MPLARSPSREDFATAIRGGNCQRLCYLLLGDGELPQIRRGLGTETELWT